MLIKITIENPLRFTYNVLTFLAVSAPGNCSRNCNKRSYLSALGATLPVSYVERLTRLQPIKGAKAACDRPYARRVSKNSFAIFLFMAWHIQ